MLFAISCPPAIWRGPLCWFAERRGAWIPKSGTGLKELQGIVNIIPGCSVIVSWQQRSGQGKARQAAPPEGGSNAADELNQTDFFPIFKRITGQVHENDGCP